MRVNALRLPYNEAYFYGASNNIAQRDNMRGKTDRSHGINSTDDAQEKDKDGIKAKEEEQAKDKTEKDRFTKEELREIEALKKRDQEVKQHEIAHIAAGGIYVRGGANFQYELGPDGRRYAVSGEVSIDTSEEPRPEATVRKMRIVQRAALAPKDPSPQDRRVAAQAAIKASRAMAEIMKQAMAEKRQERAEAEKKDENSENASNKKGGIISIYA